MAVRKNSKLFKRIQREVRRMIVDADKGAENASHGSATGAVDHALNPETQYARIFAFLSGVMFAEGLGHDEYQQLHSEAWEAHQTWRLK